MKNKLFLFLFMLSCVNISAQNIPNGGFENWDTFGSLDYPVNWLFMTSPVCTPTLLPAEKTDDSHSGNWAVKLESHTCIGMPGTNLELGFIYTGNLDGSSIYQYSIPFVDRPDQFSFFYKFHPEGGDSAFVQIMLFKYDTIALEVTDTIAFSTGYINQEVVEYTQFSLPLEYLSGNEPDFMFIIFTTSKTLGINTTPAIPDGSAHFGTTLIIDDVTVSGGTVGINPEPDFETSIKVYPNPTIDAFKLEKPENIQIQQIYLFNNIGKEIIRFSGNQTTFNVSGINPGLYFLKLDTDHGVVIRKIVIKYY